MEAKEESPAATRKNPTAGRQAYSPSSNGCTGWKSESRLSGKRPVVCPGKAGSHGRTFSDRWTYTVQLMELICSQPSVHLLWRDACSIVMRHITWFTPGAGHLIGVIGSIDLTLKHPHILRLAAAGQYHHCDTQNNREHNPHEFPTKARTKRESPTPAARSI